MDFHCHDNPNFPIDVTIEKTGFLLQEKDKIFDQLATRGEVQLFYLHAARGCLILVEEHKANNGCRS